MRNTSHLRRQHLQKSAKRRRQRQPASPHPPRSPASRGTRSSRSRGLSWVAGRGFVPLSTVFRSRHWLVAGGLSAANAQTTLDPITVLATKTIEATIDALAMVTSVRQEQIERIQPQRTSDLFWGLPSVWFRERADTPGDRDQHPRPAGLRPRRGGGRRRAAEFPALRPQRQRPVLPRSRTGRRGRRGARPGRQHLRLGRDRRRGVVPHQGRRGRAAARRTLRRACQRPDRKQHRTRCSARSSAPRGRTRTST